MDNLLALRKRLMRTEKTSQSSRTDFSSVRLGDQSDDCSQQGYSPALTTEDLSQSDPMVPAMNNRHVTMAERMTPQKCVFSNISPTSSFGGRTSQVPSTFAIEQENEQLWKKLSTLREDNARLVSQNHSLVREIESIQAELTQSKVKFCHLEPSINEKALHISQLNEDILGLEAEVEAQEKVLRVAEEKLEESQWVVAEKEKLLEKLSDECKRVKNELYEQSRRRKRAEQQRNEALYSAEELSAAFKQYKEKTTEELLMFQANEQELQRRLDQYDKDRVELFEKCTIFEKELESKNEEMRIIMGQSCDVKLVQHDLEAKNAGLFSVLSDSKEKIKMLESELTDKEAILKESDALRVENAGLRGLTTSQSEKLLQVNKELEVAKLEVKNLESILQLDQTQSEEIDSGTFGRGVANLSSLNAFSNRKENGMKDSKLNADSSDSIVTDLSIKLAMKDAEIQKLKSSLMNSKFSTQECGDILGKSCVLLDRGSPELMSNRNKKDDRRSMERHLEEERCRPIEVEKLQAQLLDAEATISMLQTQLTEQINNFEQIQEQLSEKSTYIGNVEEELRKTKSQLAIMEKQLEEKTIVCTTNAVKTIEHEQEIAEKSKEIIKLEKFIAEQHQENIFACEHIKKIQTEQYQELEQQIEILQSQLEEKEQQLKKQKQTISNVQEEISAKQSRIESLEFLLEEAKEEIKKQDNRNNAALKSLQNQTDEEASKVKDLENALAISKEELKIQSQQFEDIREQQKKQIEKKSEEKQLKISAINLKESNEQNMQLQQTLVQYQQMLQQGTARIGELEDHQAMLERQVSQLEQELYKQKMAYTDELSKTEGKLLKAYDGQDSKHQQVVELTSALKEIKTAMDKCKDETTALEKELLQLRRDSANKDIQLNQLEMTLRNTQIELDKKSDQVLDLEENLHKIETDRRNALQENQKIEAQLRNAHSELHDTLNQLKELRDVLQTAQNNMEDKKNVIEELTREIRQYKNELQDRNVKIIEMDQALKDRQWELQQRAAQLTQLDMNVHEHKTEMEQKMICLQSSLEKSELNVKEHTKQVETLDGKLQLIQEELREKDFKLLQKEQQINQLKSEVEGKDVQIDKYEQMLKDKDQCIVKQQKDVFDESQQVRIVHEQMQRCHLELRECQQHLAQTKREVERVSVELDETIRLSQEKEACAAHLAAELGAAQARETQLENRMQAETKKLKEFIKHLNNTHQREISILRERNAHSLPTIIETSEIQKSSDQLLQLNQDLEKAQECILHLESELKNQKEVINAAEESLIIKESEIARLQVKISGFERAMSKQQLQSPTLEAQNESNNRKDYTSQLKSFYPLTRNMNRPFSAHDTYGTDIGSALQSLNYSNRIRETLEQSFIEESISFDDTMDASCAGKSENTTLFSQSANSEAEENLELTNLISNSNMDTLSEMLNQLIAMEQTSTKLDSPVNKSSGLSNEQITSKPEDCSTGMYRIQDQDSAHCNLTEADLNVQSHMPVPLK
ncbi:coiled-coil domain-containing protein 18 isoform X2 [Chiloscyllium plagiosum]|uniref:coiled-coil domain-containing protein 18 isoform X2 n=1 Tax=Chiloscyllium plagiosum TaxID=36176 RepID=UPI001CB862B0|nr:coiled-coil domain-containing protein 18 isoform X2 [Chiloscyllium plagiosum]